MTTLETFEHIARHGKAQAMVDFLLRLTKQELLAIRPKTKALYREMNNWNLGNSRFPFERGPLLFLAGVACYSRKEAAARTFDLPWNFQHQHPKHDYGHWELLLQLLQHTRPTWLTDWLLRVTRSSPWQVIGYSRLRQLADAGLVEYDAWLFAQSLAQQLNAYSRNTQQQNQETTADVLRFLQTDVTLLERDLPLLFDFDTPVDSAAIYQQNEPHVTWLLLLPRLVESGHLERADLLNRCLLALRRDFRRPLLTWFKNLFLALTPTPTECLARQNEVVDLLAHPLPLVVNFALDQLKPLWTEPEFAAAPLLLYAEGLLTRQDVKTGLRTLFSGFEKLLKRDTTLAPLLASLSTTALANADATVQERAAKLLKTILGARKPLLSAAATADTTTNLCLYADFLAPAARMLLLPYLPGEEEDVSLSEAAVYVPQADFVPDISAATAIAPVRDWHELLFLTGQVLQHNTPADVERWLDGLLRLQSEFPKDYARQLHPYLVQALPWALKSKSEDETWTGLFSYSFGSNHNGQREMLLALLMSWYLGFPHLKVAAVPTHNQQYSHYDPLLRVEQQRLAAVEAALQAAGTPLPLLSTPTHAPHWVAPSVLMRRLLAYEDAGQEPNPADLCLALARTAVTAPEDVAAARRLLPLFHNPGLYPLLESFLGPSALTLPASVVAAKTIERSFTERLSKLIPFLRRPPATEPAASLTTALPWLWSVAARTQQPAATLPALRSLANYPGLEHAWQPTWAFERKSHTYYQKWNKERPVVTTSWQELVVSGNKPGLPLPSGLLLYSLHASETNAYSLWTLNADLPFLLTLLPNNADALYWHLIRIGCRTDDKESSSQTALQTVLQGLLAPGPVLTEPATLLLALGLTHGAPVCRAVALEALLAAVENGRLDSATLGEALGKLLAAEFVPVQRLTDTLAQARAISPRTDDALRQLLEAVLPLLPATPLRNTRKLVEAYADVQGRTRRAVPALVQQQLRDWSSSATLKKAAGTLAEA
ncbi:DUF6493 family protein [Hymenobacter swuensis]|uniref:Uncharacterized protein n=1 Tax=Hymenobacter swuensis DY53 TaxID=1227739 RepID=W8ESY8_9BACT|nr:DUF6493 family protein [Hymenobacter swuensis]AHJ96279.1 hypothetical protein Hsw_0684 [Hymenobacter swuensis DY53]